MRPDRVLPVLGGTEAGGRRSFDGCFVGVAVVKVVGWVVGACDCDIDSG